MSKKKVKPTYESIRYDIRPSSGLTDVESDYLNSCINKLENHPNCAEVGIAYEMSTAYYKSRNTSKHAHIFTRWKTPIRSDKMPILKMPEYIKQRKWSNKAVMTVVTEQWSPAHYWKAGYIQKEGAAVGNMKNYIEFWLEHERLMTAKKVRQPQMTAKTDVDEIVNFWYSSHELIRRNQVEQLGKKDHMGITHSPPVDIRHVWAQYLITYRVNCTDERNRDKRLRMLVATWRDYEWLIEQCTCKKYIETESGQDAYHRRFDYEDMEYPSMDEVFPIEGI